MAIVPRIEQQVDPGQSEQGVPQRGIQIQTNENMFGGQLAQATERLGATGQEVGNRMASTSMQLLDLQHNTMALEADNNWYEQRSEAEQQFKQLKGKDAVEAWPQYRQSINDSIMATAEGLPPDAKAKFMQNVTNRAFYLERGAADYVANQTVQWHTNEATNSIKIAMNNAAQNADNPTMVAQSWKSIMQATKSIADIKGGDDLYAQQLQDHYGNLFDQALVKNRGAKNPAMTLQQLNDPDMFPHLDDQQRAWYMSHLETQMKNQIVKQGFVGNTPMSDVRGIRNNNPGNIMGTFGFNGEVGTDEKGYAKYDTPENGLRALAIDLVNQEKLHGKNTIEQIVEKYAPPDSNNTAAYEEFISKTMGVPKNQKLDMQNPQVVSRLMNGVVTMENGGNPYSKDQIDYAANLGVAHLPSTKGLLNMAAGNPAAQLKIAQNATFLASPEADAHQLTTLEGDNRDRMAQAVSAKQAILAPTGDPASYLYQNNIDLQNSVQEGLSKDPTQLIRAVKEADLAYDSMHQDPTNRPILSKPLAQSMVGKLTGMGTEGALQGLEAMQSEYGTAWPRVYADLVRQGDLPVQYQAAMMMDNAIDRQQLMRAYSSDAERVKGQKPGFDVPNEKMKGLEKVKSTIDSSVDMDDTLHTFTASMYRQGATVSDANFNNVVKQLAYQKYREGADPKTAVAQAVKALTGNVDMSLRGARIPMSVAPQVKANAQSFLDSVDESNIKLPDYATDMPHYVQSLRGNSTWVNNPDDTGINLLDQAGRYVRNKQGIPVTIPFSWPAKGTAAPQNFEAPPWGGV